ncbi:MAG TPA: CoA-binding protein [Terriglobales bacterium]|nr:CoA-binding protein [Terriglobales bacterium]
MTTTRDVENFLALKRIAMVGVSRNPKDFSRHLFREMCSRGYDMVPVNWVANEIDGRESFQCLQAVKPAVEGVLIMTAAHETIRVVRDCAEARINRVWIYRAGGTGAVSEEALAFCREHGIAVVEGYCPFMFFKSTGFIHRTHGFFLKIAHRYPAAA